MSEQLSLAILFRQEKKIFTKFIQFLKNKKICFTFFRARVDNGLESGWNVAAVFYRRLRLRF
jgi:hypothetical protein